jgi:hypothetical protein
VRKTTLASLVARAAPGLRFNEHIEADGLDVFNHACKHLLATRITPHHPAVPSTPPHERLTPSCTARNIAFGKQQSASITAFTPHFDHLVLPPRERP